MPTVAELLALAALVCRVLEAMGKCPKLVADLMVCLVLLLLVRGS